MRIEIHQKILGILFLVFSFVQLMGFFTGFMIINYALPLMEVPVQFLEIVNILKYIAAAFLVLLLVPSVVGGFALLKKKPWAMNLSIVLGSIYLFLIPFGTLIGIYAIVIYLSEGKNTTQVAER